MLLCCVGLVAAIVISWRDDDTPIPYAALVAVALSLGLIGEYVDVLAHTPQYQLSLLWDVAIKLWDYWCPYFILFPAGFAVALAYDRWSRPAVFFVLMTLLIYPWHQRPDPVDFDSVEHSIAEHWAFNLHTAAEGYWAGQPDRRWTFGNDEFAVIDQLNKEIAAGRITPKTHILHIAHDTSSWTLFQFSIVTGIDDDPMEVAYDPGNLYQVGSRVRGLSDLPSVLLDAPTLHSRAGATAGLTRRFAGRLRTAAGKRRNPPLSPPRSYRSAGSFQSSSMVDCWLLLRSSELS